MQHPPIELASVPPRSQAQPSRSRIARKRAPPRAPLWRRQPLAAAAARVQAGRRPRLRPPVLGAQVFGWWRRAGAATVWHMRARGAGEGVQATSSVVMASAAHQFRLYGLQHAAPPAARNPGSHGRRDIPSQLLRAPAGEKSRPQILSVCPRSRLRARRPRRATGRAPCAARAARSGESCPAAQLSASPECTAPGCSFSFRAAPSRLCRPAAASRQSWMGPGAGLAPETYSSQPVAARRES